MKFTKPFLAYDEQADLLISRGMVADRDVLLEHLQDGGFKELAGGSDKGVARRWLRGQTRCGA